MAPRDDTIGQRTCFRFTCCTRASEQRVTAAQNIFKRNELDAIARRLPARFRVRTDVSSRGEGTRKIVSGSAVESREVDTGSRN